MKNLINKEVIIDGEEGEIIEILGCQWCVIQFFNMNIDNCNIHISEINEYLIL
ncbi:hypothetical protein [Clostridium perfringens]|uniref:hypothetical protein n=1 Tax=Clostridium perfringens TaxID=1502 RepID=UPI0024BC82FE|nr:hypothetical protein [Clostridium perfringens]